MSKLGKAFYSTLYVIAAILPMKFAAVPAFAQYDKDMFMYRGRSALADGKFSQAIENFNVLARLDTTDYENYFFRGIAKYNLGDFRGAKQDFNAAVRINPVFTSGYHYRGITESRTGNYDAALSDINKALELRPGYSGLYFSRADRCILRCGFRRGTDRPPGRSRTRWPAHRRCRPRCGRPPPRRG